MKCASCASDFERPATRGPVPKFCSAACRQRAFRRRRRHWQTITGTLTFHDPEAIYRLFAATAAQGEPMTRPTPMELAGLLDTSPRFPLPASGKAIMRWPGSPNGWLVVEASAPDIDPVKLRDAAVMLRDLAGRSTSITGHTFSRLTIILDPDGPTRLRDAADQITIAAAYFEGLAR